MSDSEGATVRRSRAARVVVVLLGVYVLVNLTIVTLVPVARELCIDVGVVDSGTQTAVPNSIIYWGQSSPRSSYEQSWSTNARGQARLCKALLINPIWMFPLVGWFDLSEDRLTIAAPAYKTQDLPLRDLKFVSYFNAHITCRVEISRSE